MGVFCSKGNIDHAGTTYSFSALPKDYAIYIKPRKNSTHVSYCFKYRAHVGAKNASRLIGIYLVIQRENLTRQLNSLSTLNI